MTNGQTRACNGGSLLRITASSVSLNGPFPSSKNPHFQNEAKHNILFGIMSFNCMRIGQLHDEAVP